MKKLLILLLCLAPVLAGLPRLYAQRRETEQLRLAETMGLDPAPEGLRLSLAAPGGGEEEPLFASAPGASVNLAMDALRQQAGGEQLFCGHLQHILLGEAYARQGLESLLSAVCRSSDLRLDMPVYLILGAEAGEAMAALDDGKAGVCDALNSLGQRKNAGLSSAGRTLRDQAATGTRSGTAWSRRAAACWRTVGSGPCWTRRRPWPQSCWPESCGPLSCCCGTARDAG